MQGDGGCGRFSRDSGVGDDNVTSILVEFMTYNLTLLPWSKPEIYFKKLPTSIIQTVL